jgi:hypothetical protein
MFLDVTHPACFNPWRMKVRKKRRRARPVGPLMKIDTVIWESQEDPDAEELLLQALEMLLPPATDEDPKDGPQKHEQLPPL